MSVYPVWRAGAKVTADRLTQQQTHVVAATADQIVNNSATLTNDTLLFFPLAANALYVVELHVAFNAGSAVPDIFTAWSVPAGTTGGRFCFGSTGTDASFTDNEITRGTARANTFIGGVTYRMGASDQSCNEILSLITAGTAGNVQFRWAQLTATVINSTRLTDSFMRVTRVG